MMRSDISRTNDSVPRRKKKKGFHPPRFVNQSKGMRTKTPSRSFSGGVRSNPKKKKFKTPRCTNLPTKSNHFKAPVSSSARKLSSKMADFDRILHGLAVFIICCCSNSNSDLIIRFFHSRNGMAFLNRNGYQQKTIRHPKVLSAINSLYISLLCDFNPFSINLCAVSVPGTKRSDKEEMECDSESEANAAPLALLKTNCTPSGFGKASNSSKDLEEEQAAIEEMTDEEYKKYKQSLTKTVSSTAVISKASSSRTPEDGFKPPETSGFAKANVGRSGFKSNAIQRNSIQSKWTRKQNYDQKKWQQFQSGNVESSSSGKMAELDKILGVKVHCNSRTPSSFKPTSFSKAGGGSAFKSRPNRNGFKTPTFKSPSFKSPSSSIHQPITPSLFQKASSMHNAATANTNQANKSSFQSAKAPTTGSTNSNSGKSRNPPMKIKIRKKSKVDKNTVDRIFAGNGLSSKSSKSAAFDAFLEKVDYSKDESAFSNCNQSGSNQEGFLLANNGSFTSFSSETAHNQNKTFTTGFMKVSSALNAVPSTPKPPTPSTPMFQSARSGNIKQSTSNRPMPSTPSIFQRASRCNESPSRDNTSRDTSNQSNTAPVTPPKSGNAVVEETSPDNPYSAFMAGMPTITESQLEAVDDDNDIVQDIRFQTPRRPLQSIDTNQDAPRYDEYVYTPNSPRIVKRNRKLHVWTSPENRMEDPENIDKMTREEYEEWKKSLRTMGSKNIASALDKGLRNIPPMTKDLEYKLRNPVPASPAAAFDQILNDMNDGGTSNNGSAKPPFVAPLRTPQPQRRPPHRGENPFNAPDPLDRDRMRSRSLATPQSHRGPFERSKQMTFQQSNHWRRNGRNPGQNQLNNNHRRATVPVPQNRVDPKLQEMIQQKQTPVMQKRAAQRNKMAKLDGQLGFWGKLEGIHIHQFILGHFRPH